MSSTHQPRARGILWTISRRLAMVIVLAFAFVLSATLTIYILFRSGDTRVPNLIGKPEAEAQKIAEKAGLRVKIQRRTDTSAPDGSVIETRPSQNSSVKKDSNLTIVVSSGPVQTKSELHLRGMLRANSFVASRRNRMNSLLRGSNRSSIVHTVSRAVESES